MSAVTSRPRVSGIVLTAAAGTVITGAVLVNALLRVAGSAVRAACRQLEAAAQLDDVEIQALCVVRHAQEERLRAASWETHRANSVDAIKLAAADRLVDYLVSDESRLMSRVQALGAATTVENALAARDALLEAVEADHHRVFTDHLATACVHASVAVGFNSTDMRQLPDGTIRIAATNEAGQALVSEIRAPRDQEPALATEVVGLRDGTCHQILDRFDAALAAEGVRSVAPHRTFTGGVCQLAAAREFVRRKPRPRTATEQKETLVCGSSASSRPRRRSIQNRQGQS